MAYIKLLHTDAASTPTPPAGYGLFFWDNTSKVFKIKDDTGSVISVSLSDELFQDAVGNILTDSASVDFTYNDAGDQITAAVLPAGVDHDQLQNFVANKHIDHSAVSISAGAGLTGGGDLTADRTIALPNSGVTADTYGTASSVGVFTVDIFGRITSAVNTGISLLSSAISNFATSVLGTVLTGLSTADDSEVAATDTVLVGIGKLQAQSNVWEELILSADHVNNSNVTLTNLSDLAFSATAGKKYYIEYTLLFSSVAGGTGIGFTVGTSDTAAGQFGGQINIPVSGDGTGHVYGGSISVLGDIVVSSGVGTTDTNYILMGRCIFDCTTSGTVLPQFRSEVNGNNVTVKTGSGVLIREF